VIKLCTKSKEIILKNNTSIYYGKYYKIFNVENNIYDRYNFQFESLI